MVMVHSSPARRPKPILQTSAIPNRATSTTTPPIIIGGAESTRTGAIRSSGKRRSEQSVPASLSFLRETERYFLRKEYKRSLLLVHRWFRNGLEEPFIEEKKKEQIIATKEPIHRIKLFPSIRIPVPNENSQETTFAFLASAEPCPCEGETAAISDQLAVIGLQSWYELSRLERKQQRTQQQQSQHQLLSNSEKKSPIAEARNNDRWSHLVEILEYYNYHEMEDGYPRESLTSSKGVLSTELLATVWISFWESKGYELEAFAWTVQALHCTFHSQWMSSRRTTASPTRRTIAEELWLRCVCLQIPSHLDNNNTALVKKILRTITEKTVSILDNDFFKGIWKDIQSNVVTEKDEDTASENCDDELTNFLIESLDDYLDKGEYSSDIAGDSGDETPLAIDLDRRSPRRDSWVSRRTVLQARRLFVQQEKRRRKSTQRGRSGNGEKTRSDDRLDRLEHSLSSPDNVDNSLSSEPVAIPSGPITAMQSVQSAVSSLPRIGILPRKALMKALQTFRTVWYSIIDGSKDGNGAFGEMPTKLLRLLYSSLTISVSDPTEKFNTASAIDVSPLSQKQERQQKSLKILRRHLQQALLSVILFWMGWRGRRLLAKVGRGLVWASLAPLREVLTALRPMATTSE